MQGDNEDSDQAKILATSFKQSDIHPPSTTAANLMTTFDNPTYAATGGVGVHRVEPMDPEEIEKEDLAMIGKPLYEDDIEL